jgi:hypothetical protein
MTYTTTEETAAYNTGRRAGLAGLPRVRTITMNAAAKAYDRGYVDGLTARESK